MTKEINSQSEGLNLPPVACANCGSQDISTSVQNDEFVYGEGDSAAKLSVKIPTRTCNKCGFQFLDYAAERIQHEAVCRHLGVLTPDEIRGIRESYGLSRADFAQITHLGTATLARWERGELIQNAAYNEFLTLLKVPANLRRLRNRIKAGTSATGNVNVKVKLRYIEANVEELEAEAAAFELSPVEA